MDEFSAVSRRLPVWQLYERARSLGLAVQVSAQSWQGLAGEDDERYRIAASADGGIWLLRTPHPDPVVALAGVQREFPGWHIWAEFGMFFGKHPRALPGVAWDVRGDDPADLRDKIRTWIKGNQA